MEWNALLHEPMTISCMVKSIMVQSISQPTTEEPLIQL